ncbi:MAG: birA [Hyphomicrobiales bacterium]|nr:birA [Hyphomicrobiales bacterium]
MERARSGDAGGLWIMARTQTAGRGRHGRPWASPPGNLHASLLLIDPAPPRLSPQIGFVAGVALIDALRVCAPRAEFGLKWPNDALSGAAKLAGVLVEGSSLLDGRFACAIGFGVDCAHNPNALAYPATNLAALGADCAPAELLSALSDSVARWLDVWRGGANFPAVRAAWLERAAGLGRPMVARTGERAIEGEFETIDEQGRLVLATPSGRVTIEAGDVFPALGYTGPHTSTGHAHER